MTALATITGFVGISPREVHVLQKETDGSVIHIKGDRAFHVMLMVLVLATGGGNFAYTNKAAADRFTSRDALQLTEQMSKLASAVSTLSASGPAEVRREISEIRSRLDEIYAELLRQRRDN